MWSTRRHVHQEAAGQRDVRSDARALLPERLLGNLDDDLLPFLQQVADGCLRSAVFFRAGFGAPGGLGRRGFSAGLGLGPVLFGIFGPVRFGPRRRRGFRHSAAHPAAHTARHPVHESAALVANGCERRPAFRRGGFGCGLLPIRVLLRAFRLVHFCAGAEDHFLNLGIVDAAALAGQFRLVRIRFRHLRSVSRQLSIFAGRRRFRSHRRSIDVGGKLSRRYFSGRSLVDDGLFRRGQESGFRVGFVLWWRLFIVRFEKVRGSIGQGIRTRVLFRLFIRQNLDVRGEIAVLLAHPRFLLPSRRTVFP